MADISDARAMDTVEDPGASLTPQNGPSQNDDDLDMNELFGSSDSDEEPGPREAHEQRQIHVDTEDVQREGSPGTRDERDGSPKRARPPAMEIPTSLHDALPPSRNHLAKLPPSVRIIPEAFREDAFEGDGRDGVDIRWRYGLDDRTSKLVRESNARIVTWSDGSQTLHVGGNAAVYKVKPIDITKDDTFLYASHARLIQCQGKLQDKLMFNPISVNQSASRPKNQSTKSIKVKQTATLVDPVKEREAKERSEEARIREKEKLIEKQKQMQRNAILNDPNFARRSYHGTRGLSAAFLEEEDDGERRMVNEEEYDEEDGWLLGDDNDNNDEDAEDDEIDDNDEIGVGIEEEEDGMGDGRTMPSADAEIRNEAALMNIMAEGKSNDQGDGGNGLRDTKTNDAKKRKVLISSDSDED